MRIVEHLLIGKYGTTDRCEDGSIVTDSFVAVVDGSTTGVIGDSAATEPVPTAGRIARDEICRAIEHLAPGETARAAFIRLNEAIRDRCRADGVLEAARGNPDVRPAAAVLVYSVHRSELWSVGDCTALVDGRLIRTESPLERIAAEARSVVLQAALTEGATEADFALSDPGRAAITPIIEAARRFRNNPRIPEYCHLAVDGFFPESLEPRVIPVPRNTREIVLATDGYPWVKPTLSESEEELSRLLAEDPLCFRRFKATKGRYQGTISFDDRCYIRIDASE
jgi:hypothetical protein